MNTKLVEMVKAELSNRGYILVDFAEVGNNSGMVEALVDSGILDDLAEALNNEGLVEFNEVLNENNC